MTPVRVEGTEEITLELDPHPLQFAVLFRGHQTWITTRIARRATISTLKSALACFDLFPQRDIILQKWTGNYDTQGPAFETNLTCEVAIGKESHIVAHLTAKDQPYVAFPISNSPTVLPPNPLFYGMAPVLSVAM